MRTIPHLATLALATGIHAASWTALPELPRGSAGTVSGDGTAVVFMNYLGGTSMHQPSSSVAPWIKLRSDAKSKSVVVRKNQIAYLVDNGDQKGVVYGALGDSVLKTAYLGNAVGPLSGIDHDGRHILAVRSAYNITPSLYLSVDSVIRDPMLVNGSPVGTVNAWRLLTLPPDFVQYNDAYGKIEGRLIVASNGTGTIVSRDTGATWTTFPIRYLGDCDISGDTIVGRSYSSKRLFVSIDAGVTWDSSALAGPWSISFRGGKLYGQTFESDSTYDLVSSANLGKTWNTVLDDVDPGREHLAWDGSALWTTKHDALLRSTNEGRTWTVADSGLGETIIRKLRAFGTHLLALQGVKHPDYEDHPFRRLWAYDGRDWKLVRDSVTDFEVMETDTGWAVFVLADSGSDWRAGTYGAKLRLERSYNLKSWQVMPGLAPYSVVLGMSRRGLLVGQKTNVAILTSGSNVLLDTAWKDMSRWSLGSRGFLVEQDGELAWAENGRMERSLGTQVVVLGESVRGYATLGSKYGYRITDTSGSWLADFAPMASAYPLLRPSLASGVAVVHDSIATWNGSDTFTLMRPEGERRVLGPQNQGVTQVEYMSTSALGSIVAMVDSTFAVADLHGRIWRFDKYGTSGVGPSRPRLATLSFHRGGLSLQLPRAAQVRIVCYDGRGRSLGEVENGWFEAGSHPLAVETGRSIAFAIATIDGIRQDPVRIPPSWR
ncbi:MAG: hypothetical protein IPO40_12825 [Fibrobacteres bacterium]|nr:hypothetical protein [Fibrobacterota bacterium]